jgi:DNA polymerase-1
MKEKTFRHDVYPEYKAGRQQTPIELLTEIPLLHRVLEAMNIAVLEKPKYEADDIIGTLTAKAGAAGGYESWIVTGDRDALQLVAPDTKVLFTKKGISEMVLFDEAAFREKYGFAPLRLIDLKGLMGDASEIFPACLGSGKRPRRCLSTSMNPARTMSPLRCSFLHTAR